jgi:DNA-binding CsgD family transcriptional regulator
MQSQLFYKTPAGVFPKDQRANIFADPNTLDLYFLKSGKVSDFSELSKEYKRQILKRLLSDPCAMADLGGLGFTKAYEQYSRCMFGSLDHVEDFSKEGQLGKPDNYRCSDNCRCMFWKSKSITYKNEKFTSRQLVCLELIAKGLTDMQIADKMQITVNSLSDLKRRLQKKLNTFCKTSTAVRAIKHKLVR